MTLGGAIKQLQQLQNAEDMPFYYKPVIAEVINVLLMDTQEMRHGHWIGDVCSKCGKDALCDCYKYDIYGTIHSDYCPHCGAKMDKTEECLLMPKADGNTINIG